MRDDFNDETKRTLAQRAGNRCSNPECRRTTSGPRTEHDLSVNIGVAAHIQAASPGGPRYDELMQTEERRNIRNGIWLCQVCAKLIDNDKRRYSVEVVRGWKDDAELSARRDLESRVIEAMPSGVESELLQPFCPPLVRIELNIDHTLRTPATELKTLIARLAVSAVEGDLLGVEAFHVGLDEYLDKIASDPVSRAMYCKTWVDLARRVSGTIQLLFSGPVLDAWSHWLCNSDDYLSVTEALINRCGAGRAVSGVKIDVWRTAEPDLSAPIFLSDPEVNAVLPKFEFKSMQDLAFGAGWRAADELPTNVILRKVLPRILMAIQSRGVDITAREPAILGLASWHIGLG
jgi:hypothetical protein